jgi:hypothetical protein
MPHRLIKCLRCPKQIRPNTTGLCADCLNQQRAAAVPSAQVRSDRDRQRAVDEAALTRRKYTEALATIERLEKQIQVEGDLFEKGIETYQIEEHHGSGTSEGMAFMTASDWHTEELVDPAIVSGLNEHNLDIARARATKFFQSGLRLVRLLQQDIKIETIGVPLLGDFITNQLYEEFAETNALMPTFAVEEAQSQLASGIEFLLDHSKAKLVLNCHSGNHGRTTRTTRFGAENGHSLEYLMYRSLAAYFRNEPRVQFIIPAGYHSYLEVYGRTIRFHHGHAINYQGGVGGIFIPAFKAIAQWNKARRADLDVFGHFHQCKDGGNFLCNGSKIGYNPFALSIKADFEEPKQQLFLIDKKRGRTCTWPILVK